MRVSIVIPAYNEESHMRACLDAIAGQTVAPYEVIVVDNNSTDQTAAIAATYPFVRVVHEKTQGRVYARNAGFNAAKSEIIGRIDADITLPPGWVAHIQAFYQQPGNERKAWTGAGYFYNVRLPRLVSWAYSLFAFRFNKLLTGEYSLWGSNMALLKNQWRAVSRSVCLRNDIHEDLDLAVHLHDAGYQVSYDPTLKTKAELRRVHTDRNQLWDYLQWWPRTLKVHNKKAWPICWFFGAFLLYLATFLLVWVDALARLLGKNRPSRPLL